jgi:hypothetical protein
MTKLPTIQTLQVYLELAEFAAFVYLLCYTLDQATHILSSKVYLSWYLKASLRRNISLGFKLDRIFPRP